jgi:hypothetical protein
MVYLVSAGTDFFCLHHWAKLLGFWVEGAASAITSGRYANEVENKSTNPLTNARTFFMISDIFDLFNYTTRSA